MKLIPRITTALAAGALLAGVTVTAVAAPYVPKQANLLNVPAKAGGSTAQQRVLDQTLTKSLDAMRPGSVARLAYYDINLPDAAAAIKRTAKRGVNVRLILNGTGLNSIETDLIKTLGTNRAKGSWAVACVQSCNSAKPSAMHAKFATLSSVGDYDARHIVFVGSANLTTTNAGLNWNQSNVIPNDAKLYTGFAKFFDKMALDKDNANVYTEFGGTNTAYRAYLWPSGSMSNANPFLAALKNTSCKTSGAYGSGGRTEIKVNMFFWTGARTAEADLLAAKQKAGCKVTVLYVNKPGTRSIDQTVLNRLWAGKVTMYNSRSKAGDIYTHGKGMIIDGTVYGRPNKVVWNGSNNWTGNYTQTNEATLRIDSNGVTAAYEANFAQMLKYSRRDTTRPIITPPTSPDSRGDNELDFQNLEVL